MTALALNRNLTGMISLALGVMIFSTQDAIIKSISGGHALTLAIVTRGLVALPILALMVHFETGLRNLRTRNFWALVTRGIVMLVAYTTYYMALAALPLAEAIALFFTAPIIVTVLAGPILGERVGLGSWFAVLIGFIGVLVILQPGHPSLDFLVRPWTMPGATDLLLMGTCGVIAAVAMSLLTHAYRAAEASLVTVFEYTGMIWGPLWGFLFFAEIPRWTKVAGTVQIIAAGIYAVRAASADS